MARSFSATSMGPSSTEPPRPRETVYPVQVLEVVLSADHPEFKNNLGIMIGSIRGRRYDAEKGALLEDLPWYNPLDPSDLKIPLIGEPVLLIEAPGPAIADQKQSRVFCYISTVGIGGQISNNASPAPDQPLELVSAFTTFTGNMGAAEESALGAYAPEIYIPPLVAFEGDRIIQGRWGNAIRFSNTSNGSEETSFWNGSGTAGDPITIISNGLEESEDLMRIEDLNDGSSNLILSSTQQIDIEASNKLPTGYPKLNQYAASQIVLSSDKIVLNSMEDNIVISGKRGVSISTPEWKADFTEMMDILKGLLVEMKAQADGVSTFATGVGPTMLNVTSQGVLNTLKTRLDKLEQ